MNYLQRIFDDSKTTKFSKLNKLAITSLLISFAILPIVMIIGLRVGYPGDLSELFRFNIIKLVAAIVSSLFLIFSLIIAVKGIGRGLGNRILYALTIIGGIIAIFYLLGTIVIIIYSLTTIPGIH